MRLAPGPSSETLHKRRNERGRQLRANRENGRALAGSQTSVIYGPGAHDCQDRETGPALPAIPVRRNDTVKTILLTAAFAVISTASHACVLSDSDINSLAASPSHLTQSEFDALTSARQNAVCSTRAFIAHVDAQKGIIKDIEPYSSKWLTPCRGWTDRYRLQRPG